MSCDRYVCIHDSVLCYHLLLRLNYVQSQRTSELLAMFLPFEFKIFQTRFGVNVKTNTHSDLSQGEAAVDDG